MKTAYARELARAHRRLERAEKQLTAARLEVHNATAEVLYFGRQVSRTLKRERRVIEPAD